MSQTPTTAPEEPVQVWAQERQGRQRCLGAQVVIPHPAQAVWQVLTDYDHLAEFIPNLEHSCRLPHPNIRLEQVGGQKVLKWSFRARVVLDIQEHFPERICFEMVEGDFQEFRGHWHLEPLPELHTRLNYYLQVTPKPRMPVALVEQRLRRDLKANLWAVRQRTTAVAG